MLNENFIFVGMAINTLAFLSYLIDVLKGKIKPNKVSFLLWSVAPLVAFFAQIKQEIGLSSLLTLNAGLVSLVIFLASFVNKKAYWKLGAFDFICGSLSLAGLLLWYITQVGNIAIFFSILSDGLAYLPTIKKAYQFPETERAWPWFATFLFGLITLLTIKEWGFASYAFPIYYLVINFVLFSCIQFKLGKRLK